MVDVTVVAPGFWTPRIDMHKWLQRHQCERRFGAKGQTVRCLHYYGNSLGLDGLLNGDCDLSGQTLLNLESSTEGLRNPCQF
jgi:hypothetical protein